MNKVEKAVILARGLGTRMRKPDKSAALSQDQMAVAGAGVKAMIPLARPFLDYVLSGLADAGYTQVCLVIGPEHQMIRDYYTNQFPPRRVRIDFAIQDQPLGTADAVFAAREFAGKDLFLVINSDNYYPTQVLTAIRDLGQPGLPLFDRDRLVAESNIPQSRVLKFAVASVDKSGFLERIYEKPFEDTVQKLGPTVYVSMNCWLFSPVIFRACLGIRPSARGELELPDAVQFAIDTLNERYKVLVFQSAVLDLSSRSDISIVAEKLKDVSPNP